jgi:hypothetical protein
LGLKEIDDENEVLSIYSQLDEDGFLRQQTTDGANNGSKERKVSVDKSIERSLKWKDMIADWQTYATTKYKKV